MRKKLPKYKSYRSQGRAISFWYIRRNAAQSESNFPARFATDMQAMTQVRRTATRRLKLITLINNNNWRHSRA